VRDINEERWNEIFNKYKDTIPNESNSDYKDRKINIYFTFPDYTNLEIIKGYKRFVYHVLINSEFYDKINFILDYDIDDVNNLLFIDIYAYKGIQESELSEFLEYLYKNLQEQVESVMREYINESAYKRWQGKIGVKGENYERISKYDDL